MGTVWVELELAPSEEIAYGNDVESSSWRIRAMAHTPKQDYCTEFRRSLRIF